MSSRRPRPRDGGDVSGGAAAPRRRPLARTAASLPRAAVATARPATITSVRQHRHRRLVAAARRRRGRGGRWPTLVAPSNARDQIAGALVRGRGRAAPRRAAARPSTPARARSARGILDRCATAPGSTAGRPGPAPRPAARPRAAASACGDASVGRRSLDGGGRLARHHAAARRRRRGRPPRPRRRQGARGRGLGGIVRDAPGGVAVRAAGAVGRTRPRRRWAAAPLAVREAAGDDAADASATRRGRVAATRSMVASASRASRVGGSSFSTARRMRAASCRLAGGSCAPARRGRATCAARRTARWPAVRSTGCRLSRVEGEQLGIVGDDGQRAADGHQRAERPARRRGPRGPTPRRGAPASAPWPSSSRSASASARAPAQAALLERGEQLPGRPRGRGAASGRWPRSSRPPAKLAAVEQAARLHDPRLQPLAAPAAGQLAAGALEQRARGQALRALADRARGAAPPPSRRCRARGTPRPRTAAGRTTPLGFGVRRRRGCGAGRWLTGAKDSSGTRSRTAGARGVAEGDAVALLAARARSRRSRGWTEPTATSRSRSRPRCTT